MRLGRNQPDTAERRLGKALGAIDHLGGHTHFSQLHLAEALATVQTGGHWSDAEEFPTPWNPYWDPSYASEESLVSAWDRIMEIREEMGFERFHFFCLRFGLTRRDYPLAYRRLRCRRWKSKKQR